MWRAVFFQPFGLQKKRLPVKIEKGTGGMSDVDISWIPQETLNVMSMFIYIVEREQLFKVRYYHLNEGIKES